MKEKVAFKIHNLQSALNLVEALTLEKYTVQIKTVYKEYPREYQIDCYKVTVLEEDIKGVPLAEQPDFDWTVRDKEPL